MKKVVRRCIIFCIPKLNYFIIKRKGGMLETYSHVKNYYDEGYFAIIPFTISWSLDETTGSSFGNIPCFC